MNIIPYEEASETLKKFSGINKLLIIALAPEAIESYQNLSTLFSLINLNGLCGIVDYCIASDLKCLMVMLGLQTCSATHPCPWCDITNTNLNRVGNLRTFNTINESYKKWKIDGKENKAKAKNYGILINPHHTHIHSEFI